MTDEDFDNAQEALHQNMMKALQKMALKQDITENVNHDINHFKESMKEQDWPFQDVNKLADETLTALGVFFYSRAYLMFSKKINKIVDGYVYVGADAIDDCISQLQKKQERTKETTEWLNENEEEHY